MDKYPRLFESNCMALAYIVIYIGANHIIPMGMGRWFKRITKEFAQYIYKEYKEPEDKKN